MIVDRLEPVEIFRVYANESHFLVDLRFKGSSEQLMKIPRSGVKPNGNLDNNTSGDAENLDSTSDSNASGSAVL